MHEATIAAEILEIAGGAAAGRTICSVRIRVGMLTGVASEALQFAFECLRPSTACAQATLEIERVPVRGHCAGCGWDGVVPDEFVLLCPQCTSVIAVVAGRELEVASIDLEGSHGAGDSREQDPEEE